MQLFQVAECQALAVVVDLHLCNWEYLEIWPQMASIHFRSTSDFYSLPVPEGKA